MDSFTKLLQENERAHAFYLSLPLNFQEEVINQKEKIKSIADLERIAELLERQNSCCGD